MKQRRLLLLAMSGVRVQNAALLEAGLTLPGFVERSRVIASMLSLDVSLRGNQLCLATAS